MTRLTRSRLAALLPALLLVLLVLSGCSTGLKLGYDNLESLALWEVDSEIDLDDAQKAAFRTEFRALHRWHRQSQLPLYAADLRALAAAIAGNAELGAAATAAIARAEQHGEQLWAQARPGVERLLDTVSDAQIADYDRRQRKRLDKEARKHADDTLAERRADWLKDWRNSLDRWIGTLNDRQRALLDAAWESEHPLLQTPAERAAFDRARHQRLIAALATRHEPGFAARLIAGADPAEKTRSDAAQARGQQLLARLLTVADDRQRQKLKTRLLELAEDFDTLAQRGASIAVAAP